MNGARGIDPVQAGKEYAKQIVKVDFAEMAQVLDLANIIIHDERGHIQFWTTGCERLYGWSATKRWKGHVYELLKTSYPLPRGEIMAVLRERGNYWQGEVEHQTKHGSPVTVSSLWVGRRAPDGRILSILQNNTDITALKRAQTDLMAREAHLRSSWTPSPRRRS